MSASAVGCSGRSGGDCGTGAAAGTEGASAGAPRRGGVAWPADGPAPDPSVDIEAPADTGAGAGG